MNFSQSIVSCVALLALASCSATGNAPTSTYWQNASYTPINASQGPTSSNGYVQGLIGLTELSNVTVDLEAPFGTIQDGGADSLPLLGGAMQRPLRGERTKLGFEGGFTAGWEGDTGAVAVGPGSVLVVSDNDILLMDFFLGAYLDTPLGQKGRLYAGAGPLLQYGRVDLEYVDPFNNLVSIGDSGWGGGVYARVGIEFDLGGGSLVGFAVRWIEADVSLGGGIDEIDYEAIQYAITVSTGV